MQDTCGNCKFLNESKKMINNSFVCNFHGLTTKQEYIGCYKIQNNKIIK